MANTRHIWVFRHGKSEVGSPGQRDASRELNERGRRDGERMQTWLAAQPHPAQWLWVSSAARTQATARFITSGFEQGSGAAPEVLLQDELYLAGPEQLLDTLAATPDEVTSVAIVAHNPGITYLVNLLAGEVISENVVTFAGARFTTAASWHALTPESTTLAQQWRPRDLA